MKSNTILNSHIRSHGRRNERNAITIQPRVAVAVAVAALIWVTCGNHHLFIKTCLSLCLLLFIFIKVASPYTAIFILARSINFFYLFILNLNHYKCPIVQLSFPAFSIFPHDRKMTRTQQFKSSSKTSFPHLYTFLITGVLLSMNHSACVNEIYVLSTHIRYR